MDFTKLAEVEWDFEDLDVNHQFCMAHANFVHKDACEFILHIGSDLVTGGGTYRQNMVQQMRAYGCTEDFIKEYEKAADAGALRVLFWK
jgi:hypothetical protein